MPRLAVAYTPSEDNLELPADDLKLPADVELLATIAGDLPAALERISAGDADTLALARLGDGARSIGELVRLLDWLAAAGASLVAADVELDSATPAGLRAIALVREIDRWGRHPRDHERPRGRPGLGATAPALARRITSLREAGLSLHAIADRLNAEGVPTPRGGALWRASSVQAALGYRRPRPPVPGPPPRPRPPKPGRAPERPKPRKPPGPRP